jgi:Holliday junction resolvase RusA-like endonuclease
MQQRVTANDLKPYVRQDPLKITVKGSLPGLNEYTEANRRHKYEGSQMKKNVERSIFFQIKAQAGTEKIEQPVFIEFLWIEQNRKRDLDNIAFAKKFIQDALVKAGVLKGDGWRHIVGFKDSFDIDSSNPRVEVTLIIQSN